METCSCINPARKGSNPRGFSAFAQLTDQNFLGDLYGGGNLSAANQAGGLPPATPQTTVETPGTWSWVSGALGEIVRGAIPSINQRIAYEINPQGQGGQTGAPPASGGQGGAVVVTTGAREGQSDSGKWIMGGVAVLGGLIAAKTFNLI